MGSKVEGHAGTLRVEEEVRLLWREPIPPKGVNLKETFLDFQRKCEAWVYRPGIPARECPDIVSGAICDKGVQETLRSTDVPLDKAVFVLRLALQRNRACTWRRLRRSRSQLTWDDFAEALVAYLNTETQAQQAPETHYEELACKARHLLLISRSYFLMALDSLCIGDRALLSETYNLGTRPPDYELPTRTRGARNVALYRARVRFLRSVRRVVADAILYGPHEDCSSLKELLWIIDNGRLAYLMEFGSRQQSG